MLTVLRKIGSAEKAVSRKTKILVVGRSGEIVNNNYLFNVTGVGKSSLIDCVAQDQDSELQELSTSSLIRHEIPNTVQAAWYVVDASVGSMLSFERK